MESGRDPSRSSSGQVPPAGRKEIQPPHNSSSSTTLFETLAGANVNSFQRFEELGGRHRETVGDKSEEVEGVLGLAHNVLDS